jgi:hypothetical protein
MRRRICPELPNWCSRDCGWCPLDESDEAEGVLKAAAAFACNYQAQLRLVHVVETPPATLEADFSPYKKDLINAADLRLRELKKRLGLMVPHAVIERKSPQRKRLAKAQSLPGGLGGLPYEEYLFVGKVSPLSRPQGQEACHCCCGPYHPGNRIPHAQKSATLSRSWRRLLRSQKLRATQAFPRSQT